MASHQRFKSRLNISSFFFQMESSLVNVSDLSEFVACIIPDNVSSSGELTRTSFVLLHDRLVFSGVASKRLVLFTGAPLTFGRVAVFTI